MNLFLTRSKSALGKGLNSYYSKISPSIPMVSLFCRKFTTTDPNNPIDNPQPEKFEHVVPKKKIFNKKTHYRNLDIDNQLSPAKNMEEQDERELINWQRKLIFDKKYLKIMDDWQKNLMNKKRKKALTKHLYENYPKLGEQQEKFVVHNPEKTLSLPAPDDKLFAVILYKGFQHKITKDDTIMLEKVDNLNVGDTFLFEKVLLVASDEYTSIGRPYVTTAKVLATVEEKSNTEKVIVFKKKRRKGYQRNQGHRQQVTVVRIMKILHTPPEECLENYHTLVKI